MTADERLTTYIRSLERPECQVLEKIEQEALKAVVSAVESGLGE